jgi:hypothetical protein
MSLNVYGARIISGRKSRRAGADVTCRLTSAGALWAPLRLSTLTLPGVYRI